METRRELGTEFEEEEKAEGTIEGAATPMFGGEWGGGG
jgi:hypothetical protein